MASAPVGDDVFGEDPTVLRLEATLAERLGKSAGVFFPTGTQSNLATVLAHCGRGDEVFLANNAHIFRDEAAGVSVLGGVAMTPVATGADGAIDDHGFSDALHSDDMHYPRARLLCLENTVHGHAIPLSQVAETAQIARDAGLMVHLDGARFFNALEAHSETAHDLAQVADTVSVCLSKGLGAPMGSVCVGPAEVMAEVRRHRKTLGGGMRQSGIAAAAGLFALDHHLPDLENDHRRAATLANALAGIGLGPVRLATNMVFLRVERSVAQMLRAHLQKQGVLIGGQTPEIRMVLHRDIDDRALTAAIEGFLNFAEHNPSCVQGSADVVSF